MAWEEDADLQKVSVSDTLFLTFSKDRVGESI
jgi:hypothetical protein